MMKKVVHDNIIPLTKEQLTALQSVFITLSVNQLIWVSGYLWGLVNITTCKNTSDNILKVSQLKKIDITSQIFIISASQTGNARRLAEQLRDSLVLVNLNVSLCNARDFKFKQIATIKLLIVITSTHGEGEPPEEAISLYKYLLSKKALRMEHTKFAVFGLGDRSYQYFAQAGKIVDSRLEELGAYRLCERVDVDLDFQDIADVWIKKITLLLQKESGVTGTIQQKSYIESNIYLSPQQHITYCKKSPFVASLLTKQRITSCSSLKDVHHLEIDLTNSNLIYQPGDALGVWYENDLSLINEILELLHLTGKEQVQIKEKSFFLIDALRYNYELTQNTSVVVKNMAVITNNKVLHNLLLEDGVKKLNEFVAITPIVDMIRDLSIKLSPQDLLRILCPMKPRFYSISSAQEEVGEEVHITVGVVRYKINGRSRTGGASGYLVDRLQENDKMRVFIMSNNNFRLPQNSDVPVVMIGAGTGIAPFRAFMQKRSVEGALGKNWLFFGNLRFIDDFLYQMEWQRYVKDGLLTNVNTAWSREQTHKIYVQDKLLQNGFALWSWIQEGAYVYVCGDAHRMAHDVEQTLALLVSKYGDMDIEAAYEFWDNMRVQNRYQRDIY